MEVEGEDGRTQNLLKPLACSHNILYRAHGSASWSLRDRKLELKRTRTLRKQTGQIGNLLKSHLMRMRPWLNGNKEALEFKFHHVWVWFRYSGLPVRVQLVIQCLTRKLEEEYEMILKRKLQSICLLTINPNTTTSIIIQVINDDGAVSFRILLEPHFIVPWLLSCAINAACVALVDAGIPTEHLAVAVCCCVAKSGCVILDPTRLEEQIIIEFPLLIYYIHDTRCLLPEGSSSVQGEPIEHGIVTSVTNGIMSDGFIFHQLPLSTKNLIDGIMNEDVLQVLELSEFLRRNLQQHSIDSSKAG
ncbi:hypothetical protein Golax_003564 [Gossypium laxum]|uniref:Exoribonuclease phosphorolytic domain-containing protein n=1 Tax=Gossypium laxum TaxID=34288 RepID=A0A7J9AHJ5_9ROSI|nr:hypothetical protein [Gossypium laxum]